MHVEHPTIVKLERAGWTAVKAAFVALVLSLILSPATKGRTGFAGAGLETVLPARIKAAGLHGVNAELAGRLTRLAVKAGDPVAAGQVLAIIENEEIEGLVERARRRAELAAARTPERSAAAAASAPQRKWLDEQHRAATASLKASEQRLREFSLADAEQAHTRAQAASGRIRALLEQRLATAREAEDAERDAANELRNLNARSEQAARLRQEFEAAQSQVKMAKLQLDSAAPVQADPGYASLEYEEAQAALRNLENRRQKLTVTSRQNGTVIQVNAAEGDAVQEGAVLFQIVDSANLHFDVSAPATMARLVHVGDPVVVRVPADPPVELAARVGQVLLEPDPQQPSYRIRVTIPNPAPDRLLVGLEGAVSFRH